MSPQPNDRHSALACQRVLPLLHFAPMLSRIGVSLEHSLLADFDVMIASRGYANRSEAIRDLIRDALVSREWESGSPEGAGAVVLVYDHRRRDLQARLTDIQHQAHSQIIGAMHAHLDHDNCIEVVLLRGKTARLREIGDRLIATRGVKHGRMVFTTVGKRLS